MFIFQNHPDHASLIETALREYLARPRSYSLPVEAELFAKTLHALPAYADIGAALLIRPQGSVLSISSDQVWSEHSEWETVSDLAWINAAYLSAIQKHPNLKPLLPPKPPTAKTCESCAGTGHVLKLQLACPDCCTLGWTAPDFDFPWPGSMRG